jgi:hypothetical protein
MQTDKTVAEKAGQAASGIIDKKDFGRRARIFVRQECY